jgi:hypothetical protein
MNIYIWLYGYDSTTRFTLGRFTQITMDIRGIIYMATSSTRDTILEDTPATLAGYSSIHQAQCNS